mgnify:CR=1 FL=1
MAETRDKLPRLNQTNKIMIKEKANKVEDILKRHPQTKDSDSELIALFWWEELANNSEGIDRDNFKIFLRCFREGVLTMPDTITRARRKIQEEIPSLRGEKYNKRHSSVPNVKKEIRNWKEKL